MYSLQDGDGENNQERDLHGDCLGEMRMKNAPDEVDSARLEPEATARVAAGRQLEHRGGKVQVGPAGCSLHASRLCLPGDQTLLP